MFSIAVRSVTGDILKKGQIAAGNINYFGSWMDPTVVEVRIRILHYLHFSVLVAIAVVVSECMFIILFWVVLVSYVDKGKSQGVICAPGWNYTSTSRASSNRR